MSILNRLPQVRGQYRENVSLAKFCWFQCGGNAAALYKPQDTEDLQQFIRELPQDVPYFVFGVGSNLLIRDGGFEGVAIRLGREFNFADLDAEGSLRVGAATLDVNVAETALQHSLTGLEFLAGIPGTIGGALAMNAGAYGSEIKDVLIDATAVDKNGNKVTIKAADFGFTYRHNPLAKGLIFTECRLLGATGDTATIKAKIDEIQSSRSSTQPIRSRTGGSTFKNPEGAKAWQLIDQAGLRGHKIGGAKVSEMHCNFFINEGDATANDLEQLIIYVQQKVQENSGIRLEPEIKIIGKS